MTKYKIAVALEAERYKKLSEMEEGRWLLSKGLQTKWLRTPDDNYVIITGEDVNLGTPEYGDFLREMEYMRHAIVTISDEGEICSDIETEDSDGCDDLFGEIFGRTVHICLWQDPNHIIV